MSPAEADLNLATKAWLAVGMAPQRGEPPLQLLDRSLSEARLALITTGGLVPPGQRPFRTGKLGDSSFREIPEDCDPESLEIYHPHYDVDLARRDLGVVFPISICRELARQGIIGSLAPTHYSFMGYIPLTRSLQRSAAPEVAKRMRQQQVDLALLVPA